MSHLCERTGPSGDGTDHSGPFCAVRPRPGGETADQPRDGSSARSGAHHDGFCGERGPSHRAGVAYYHGQACEGDLRRSEGEM